MVIWSDGQKFGPADMAMLNQWIAEGRIKPETELESVVDGTRLSAASLPGLNFGGAAATPSEPTAATPADTTPVETAPASGGAEQFFVVGADGGKYGPADAATLTQWAAENRLNPNSELESASTGARTVASQVPGIIFPVAAAAQANPMQPTPTGQYSSSSVESNYPRPGFGGNQPTSDDLRKFNWGAFLLNWIWGLNHKYPLALVALAIGIVGALFRDPSMAGISMIFSFAQLGFCIWLGVKGNEIAWNSGRFATVDEMHKCQVIWAKWGVGILVVGCVCGLGLGIMAGIGLAAMGGGLGR
ncbi:MAG: hypothetical protein KF824_01385 [Fimbriimonadaceae bacterium]|nr:MAG: hypothetical protein KF824_01385 [Fimbriimonadaceae bacterium]